MTYNWRVAAFGASLTILLSAAPLLEPCRNVGAAFAQQPETTNSLQVENDARPLEAGKPIEREMAGGQKHYYKIALEAGQYLHLVVDQRGADVAVTLFDPNDKQVVTIDSPNGTQGPEPVIAIAKTSGTYRLEVQSLEKGAPSGRYEVKIADLRMATSQDRSHVLAESAFAEGKALELQRTAESLKRAIAKYEEALGQYRAAGDRSGEASTLNNIGLVYDSLGERRKALDCYNHALTLMRAAGDRGGEATTLTSLGIVYDALGEKQKALDYHNQALLLMRAVGDRRGEASTLNNLASVYVALGEKQKALDYFNQALPIRRAVGDRGGEAATLNNLASVYAALGEKQRALDHYNQALTLIRAVGNRWREAYVLTGLGFVYNELGDRQRALDYYNQALPLLRAAGDREGEAITLNYLGFAYHALGAKQKALDHYNQALALIQAVGNRWREAYVLNDLGFVYNELGEEQRALDCYNQALRLAGAVGDRNGQVIALLGIARIEDGQGKLFDARSRIESALNLIESLRTKIISPELRALALDIVPISCGFRESAKRCRATISCVVASCLFLGNCLADRNYAELGIIANRCHTPFKFEQIGRKLIGHNISSRSNESVVLENKWKRMSRHDGSPKELLVSGSLSTS